MIYVDRGHLGDTSLLTEIDLASGARKTIVDWPALNYDPAYAPDGSEIAFASNVTGEYAIYRQRLADGQIVAGDAPARGCAISGLPAGAAGWTLTPPARRGATRKARGRSG